MQTLRARCRWVPHERMVVDVLTKRHGNSVTMLRLLRDGILSIVDEDRELAMRKVYVKRTNVTCDHINKKSKRKRENMTDEMQWVVLTRSRPMRPVVAILDKSVSCPFCRGPMLVSIIFGMWCILVCHPHLTIISCRTAVWAQACVLDHKTSFVISLHIWFTRRPQLCLSRCRFVSGAVSRYCHFWYILFGPSQL